MSSSVKPYPDTQIYIDGAWRAGAKTIAVDPC